MEKNFTISDLKKAVHEEGNVTLDGTNKVFEVISKTVEKALEEGKTVYLFGLGTLRIVSRKGRKGRNPKTKEEIQIPAYSALKFKPSAGTKKKFK